MHSIFADDAGGHGTLTNQGISDEASSVHFRYAALDGCEQVALDYQRVTRQHHLSEAHIFDSEEIRPIVFRLRHRVKDQYTADLCHGLDLQHTGEYRVTWEVALEEVFIGSNVLYTCNAFVVEVNNLVDEQEWIAVGKGCRDLVDVHDRRKARVVFRSSLLVGFLHRLLQLLREGNVGRVTRP